MTHAVLFGILVWLVGCQIDVPLSNAAAAPTLTPSVAISSEIADYAIEAASNWEEATRAGVTHFAPVISVADGSDAASADWTVMLVDHVDASCITADDLDPRGCTLGGPTEIRAQRGPFVFEGTAESARKMIQIRRDVSQYEIVSTIMHEYGHALSLKHLPAGLMNPNRAHSERINPIVDAATLDDLAAITSHP